MLFRSLLNCPLCDKRQGPDILCLSCYRQLKNPIIMEDSVALGGYEGVLEQAIKAYKFKKLRALHQPFAKELAPLVRSQGWRSQHVCAVPLHWQRLAARGFNQSALLGKALAKELGKSYVQPLSRIRATQQQARLRQADRQRNLKDAFHCRPTTLRSVILVDDVVTTGATLAACHEELKKQGVERIYYVSLARA